jgi:hypothetical protein
MSRKMLTPLNLLTRASDPSSGHEGDVYFNTSDMVIKVHNGVVWVPVTQAPNSTIPFYEHTHGTDGEVNTVYPVPLSQNELGNMGLLVIDDGNVNAPQTLIYQNIDDGAVATQNQEYTQTFDGGTV